jgi:hypothetical protein
VLGGVFLAQLTPALFAPKDGKTESRPANPLSWFSTPEPETVAEPAPAPEAEPAPPPAITGEDPGLRSRVERLERGQMRTADAAATALATALLIEAAQTSRSFRGELSQVEHLLPESPDVVRLRALSAQGAPTRAVLAGEFADAATAAVTDANKPGPEASLMQHVRYVIASIVTVRRVGDVKGKSTDAILARAELHAKAGELEQALTELSALPAPAQNQKDMRAWIDKARARVEIDRRIAGIRAASLKALNDTLAAAG